MKWTKRLAKLVFFTIFVNVSLLFLNMCFGGFR